MFQELIWFFWFFRLFFKRARLHLFCVCVCNCKFMSIAHVCTDILMNLHIILLVGGV